MMIIDDGVLLDRMHHHLVGSMMMARGALLPVPMKAWLESELKMRSIEAVLMGVYPSTQHSSR